MSVIAPGPFRFFGISYGPVKMLFAEITDPNQGPDSPSGDLAGCGIGSLFSSRVDGSLWSKTGAANQGANPFGVWTSRS